MASKGHAEVARAVNRRKLRQATIILPTTGERVRRDVTLRDPRISGTDANGNGNGPIPNEQTSLLPKTNTPPSRPSRLRRLKSWTTDSGKTFFEFCKTPTARGVLKCSLAYFIATLATFFEPVESILKTHQDGNQLAVNVVVWFDPARSAGSMDLGVLLGFLAFIYGCIIAFSSQAVAFFFGSQDLLIVGHAIVLILFCWGGLGLLAWFKQYMSHPLVNTASSLASLAIVTCMTKEGVVQTGDFSYFKVLHVLKMFVVGIFISFAVNLLLWPVSARRNVRESLMKTTDAFADLLATITASFLAGSEEDMNHPVIVAASDRFKTVFGALPNQLAEARYEHHPLGTESQYHIEKRLVECVQQLAQDMGGLRSAAATQFALLADCDITKAPTLHRSDANGITNGLVPNGNTSNTAETPETLASASMATNTLANGTVSTSQGPMGAYPTATGATSIAPQRRDSLESIDSSTSDNDPLSPLLNLQNPILSASSPTYKTSVETPAQVFGMFIEHLGPPMKSLAYTVREILKALPYGPFAERNAGNLPRFRSSLTDALNLYDRSRKQALEIVYKSKELSLASSVHVAADFEEVAASCGHFSSSLQDFAETCLRYIDILDELELEVNERPGGRTWNWLKFWHFRKLNWTNRDAYHFATLESANVSVPTSSELSNAPSVVNEKTSRPQPFPYRLYPYLSWFRRDDVKFAIKVGGGATFYAAFAFIPAFKPYFDHFHLEWGLVSYMLVCSMNMGSSNTTGWSRTYGTLLGAIVAILVWVICQENAVALALVGWLVSLVCFYFIVAKGQGPMGRFILLTYNLSVLYSYSLTVKDPDANDDEDFAGVSTQILEVAFHRFTAVLLGVIGGLIVTHYVWAVSAREKVKNGLSLLWLRMGLIWKRGPLNILTDDAASVPKYMDIRTETRLREYLDRLDSLRGAAASEFKLRGPFPNQNFEALVKSTSRMLDAFHALSAVISKDLKASAGEAELLQYTAKERESLARGICHMLSVLAASLNMEYPLNDTLPRIEHIRDRLLARIFEYRQSENKKTKPKDSDYELLYCYVLVTAQIAQEVQISGKELQKLYDSLGEKVLKLQ